MRILWDLRGKQQSIRNIWSHKTTPAAFSQSSKNLKMQSPPEMMIMPCYKTTATTAAAAVGGAAVMAGITWMCLLQGVPSWHGVRTPHPLSTHRSAAGTEWLSSGGDARGRRLSLVAGELIENRSHCWVGSLLRCSVWRHFSATALPRNAAEGFSVFDGHRNEDNQDLSEPVLAASHSVPTRWQGFFLDP